MSALPTGVAGSGPRPPSPVRVAVLEALSGPVEAGSVVIAGAGCAGLAVAVALRAHGEQRPIALLDGRQEYLDDREWCCWADERTPSPAPVSASWRSWVVSDGATAAACAADGLVYRMVRASDYYRQQLTALAAGPGTTVRLSVRVREVRERPGRAPEVVTSEGVLHPAEFIDARGPRLDPRTARAAQVHGAWLAQDFLGQWVESREDVFDPDAATLMDFATAPAEQGLAFVYVLPVSRRRALVESVTFGPARTSTALHRERIARWLRGAAADAAALRVDREERGCIPMTDRSPGAVASPHHWRVGLAGDAARPSTGYAFERIQRSAEAVAAAITSGRAPAPLDPWRRRMLDRVFLRFLSDRPDLAPAVFVRMFAAADPALVVRFLSDRSSVVDDLRLVLVLPKRPLLLAAVRAALRATARPTPPLPARARVQPAR